MSSAFEHRTSAGAPTDAEILLIAKEVLAALDEPPPDCLRSSVLARSRELAPADEDRVIVALAALGGRTPGTGPQ